MINITVFVLLSIEATAQKPEMQFKIGSGLFKYQYYSDDPVYIDPFYSMLVVDLSNPSKTTYANRPRGNQSGFSLDIAFGLKKITSKKFVWGTDFMAQIRGTTKNVKFVFDPSQGVFSATGTTKLQNYMIGVDPFFGKRLSTGKESYVDILFGFNILTSALYSSETTNATVTASGLVVGKTISGKRNQNGRDPIDIQTHLRAEFAYKHWGCALGYNIGLANEEGGPGLFGIGHLPGSYSRYLNAGIFYRLAGNPH